MKDKREIEQIFSDKLKDYEADVNPELWNNIASQISATATPVVGGITFLSKVIIGAVASVIIGSVIYLNIGDNDTTQKDTLIAIKEVKKENNASQESVTVKEGIHNEEIEILKLNRVQTISRKETFPVAEIVPIVDVVPLIKKENETLVIEQHTTQESDEEPRPDLEELIETEEEEEVIEELNNYSITKMPDIFSPNNDGANDIFFVTNEGLSNFNVVIMNNRNETVFQSQNPDFKWDGVGPNGQQVPEGKYVYFVIAKDRKNNTVNKHSMLTIVR